MPLAQREPPKRGAKCDSCGKPATALFYAWHACDLCAAEAEETYRRWAAEKAAQEATDEPQPR